MYFLAMLGLLCYFLPEMIVVVLLLAWPYNKLVTFYRFPARDLRRLESISKSPLNSQFSEVLRGATTIKAFRKVDGFRKQHLALSEVNTRMYWAKWAANQVPQDSHATLVKPLIKTSINNISSMKFSKSRSSDVVLVARALLPLERAPDTLHSSYNDVLTLAT